MIYTVEILKGAEAVVPIPSLFHVAVWPLHRPDRFESNHRLPQTQRVEKPRVAILSGLTSFPEQINGVLGAWYVALDLINVFFPIPPRKQAGGQFTLTWNGQQNTFTVLLPWAQTWVHIPRLFPQPP